MRHCWVIWQIPSTAAHMRNKCTEVPDPMGIHVKYTSESQRRTYFFECFLSLNMYQHMYFILNHNLTTFPINSAAVSPILPSLSIIECDFNGEKPARTVIQH